MKSDSATPPCLTSNVRSKVLSVSTMEGEDQTLRHRHQSQYPSAPPPSYEECVSGSEAAGELPVVPPLSYDEARQALLRKVNRQWFVNKAPAIEFEFVRMQPSSAYRYELQTFTESRSTAWAFKPYHSGETIDRSEGAEEPDPWSLHAQPRGLFEDEERKIEIPYTASMVVCHDCGGVGKTQCWKCKGGGSTNCSPCSGSGMVEKQPPHHHDNQEQQQQEQHWVEKMTCNVCRGAGRVKCSECVGSGEVKCELCKSAGRLKKYREVTVVWKTLCVDRIIELTGLDHKCIREAQGRTLVDDERPQVTPLTDFLLPAINATSDELIKTHAPTFFEQKVLMQRQRVFFVPVHEVTCLWKDNEFTYWVYGYDNTAHCCDYPGNKCDCTNCTVL